MESENECQGFGVTHWMQYVRSMVLRVTFTLSTWSTHYWREFNEVQVLSSTVSRFNFDIYRPSIASRLPEAKIELEESILRCYEACDTLQHCALTAEMFVRNVEIKIPTGLHGVYFIYPWFIYRCSQYLGICRQFKAQICMSIILYRAASGLTLTTRQQCSVWQQFNCSQNHSANSWTYNIHSQQRQHTQH